VKHASSENNTSFHESNWSGNRLDVIYTDVWVLVQKESTSSNKYLVTFIDNFSRHTIVEAVETKQVLQSEATPKSGGEYLRTTNLAVYWPNWP
jgi:ornithine carbamoyltransferase